MTENHAWQKVLTEADVFGRLLEKKLPESLADVPGGIKALPEDSVDHSAEKSPTALQIYNGFLEAKCDKHVCC